MNFEFEAKRLQVKIDAIKEEIEMVKVDKKRLDLDLMSARADLRMLALTGAVQDTIPFQAPDAREKGQPVSR